MSKYLLLLPFFLACKSDPKATKREKAFQWQYLTIELNDSVFQLMRGSNTLSLALFGKGEQQYALGGEEADSLFSFANQLVLFEGNLSQFCTDYAGSLKLRIRYTTQLYKEATFLSLCDWRDIAVPARQMDNLLKKLMKVK